MGVFDNVKNDDVGVDTRNDDGDGTFLQIIDSAREEQAQNGTSYVKLYKTNFAVLTTPKGPDKANEVGEETTQAFFVIGKNGSYGIRDLKKIIMVSKGLSPEDAAALRAADLNEALLTPEGFQETFAGKVFEVQSRVRMTQADTPKPYSVVDYKRVVPMEELPHYMTEEQVRQFFPHLIVETATATADAAASSSADDVY